MEIKGEYRISADRQSVWDALNDPEVLRACIPGCDEIEKVSDTEFKAKVTLKIGPVKAHFTGAVTLSDLDPPNRYTISGEGQGGAVGFARGKATVELIAESDATLLRYVVEANVGGKLAQIGSRLIDSSARKLANEFFGAFVEQVGGVEVAAEEAPVEAPEARPRGMPTTVWVALVIAIIIVVLLYFGGVFDAG